MACAMKQLGASVRVAPVLPKRLPIPSRVVMQSRVREKQRDFSI